MTVAPWLCHSQAGGVAATEIAYVPITGVDGYTASDAAVSVFSIQA